MRELREGDFAVLTAADVKMLEMAATPGVIYCDDFAFDDDEEADDA